MKQRQTTGKMILVGILFLFLGLAGGYRLGAHLDRDHNDDWNKQEFAKDNEQND